MFKFSSDIKFPIKNYRKPKKNKDENLQSNEFLSWNIIL